MLVAERPGCGDSCNKVLTVGGETTAVFEVEEPTAELYTPPPI
ncbi:MAG TPA: hypothetical protein VK988_11105 [Acidimicrobiales bacterium]|nr:hypothetical protein [Acidimicrobiales bacterium]